MATEQKAKDVMQYVLGDPEFIGVTNRSRRVGEKTGGDKDNRPQIRYGWKLRRAVALTPEQANDPIQQFIDLQAARYINVDMAKKFAAFNGKTEAELTESELLGYDGKVIEIDSNIIPLYIEEFNSTEAQERGAIEEEFKAVAAYYRNSMEGAAKQAEAEGDAAKAEAMKAKAKTFTAAYVKGVYNGNIAADEKRAAAITKRVDDYRKKAGADAEI